MVTGKTYDLSKRGTFIITDIEVKMGEQFEIKLTRPEEKTLIEGQGKVVWINANDSKLPVGFGINFMVMELSGNRLIRKLIKDPEHTQSTN